MDVRLPNGKVIKGVPDGTPKEVVMQKAIAAGLATEADFGTSFNPAGLVKAGNIDLTKRPVVKNPDGSISTVRSMSVGFDDGEYLIPTVSDDGRIMSEDEAINNFMKTGRHLGVFKTPADATAYAESLHNQQADMYLPKEKTFPEKLAGFGESAAAIASGMIAEPIAGLAGLASLPFKGADAGGVVDQVKSALTYQPKTELGQQYVQNIGEAPVLKQIGETMQAASQGAGDLAYNMTGSPAAGAVASAVPEALMQAVGLRTPAALGSAAAKQSTRLAEQAKYLTSPTAQQTAQVIQSGKIADVADVANPDPQFFKAMQDLDIKSEPLPSFSSQNPEYRGVEMGLSAIPGSPIAAQGLQFTEELAKKADDIISQYGGELDKPLASNQFRTKMDKTLGEMEDQASDAYKLIGERLDKKVAAQPTKTMEFVNNEYQDLALGLDDPDVPSIVKDMVKSLSPRQREVDGAVQSVPATYANMDKKRRDIGAALYKKEGPFKDADSGLLSRLYATLTDDMDAMADAQGLSGEVKAAKAIVAKRKGIEQKLQDLLGKDLKNDVVPAVESALTKLKGGKIEDFRRTMDLIPEADRQTILMTAMNKAFRGTAQGADRMDATQYSKWHADTLRNPSVRKAFEKYAPPDALQKLDAMNIIASGVSKALKDKKPTGVVNAMFNEKSGIFRNLAGKAAGVAANAATKGLAGGVVNDIISASTNQAKAAGNLLSDPALAQAIREGVEAGYVSGRAKSARIEAANKKLSKSKKYQEWANTLSEKDRAKLLSVGAVNFILESSDEDGK